MISPAVQRGQRDLAGAGEIELVGRHVIGLFLVAREMAGGDERLRPRQRRHGHQGEAVGGEPLLRPEHQRLLEQGEPALEAILPRARHLRDPREIRPVVLLDQSDMVERLEIEGGNRPFLADDDVGALVRPDRRALPGDVGHAQQQRVERRLLLAERRLDLADLARRSPWPWRRAPAAPRARRS